MTKNDLLAALAIFAIVAAFFAFGVFCMAKIEQLTGWNDTLRNWPGQPLLFDK